MAKASKATPATTPTPTTTATPNPAKSGKGGKGGGEKTEKIRLIHSEPVLNGDAFGVDVEAMVIAVDGKVKLACPVSVYEGLTRLDGGNTDGNGKVVFPLSFPLNRQGKEVKVRVQIDGSPAEAFDNITLPVPTPPPAPPAKFRGRPVENWKKNKKTWAKDVAKATLAMIIALFLLGYAGEGNLNLLIGITFGAYMGVRAMLNLKFLYGIVIIVGTPILFRLFPGILTGPLSFAVPAAYVLGGIFYFLEEAFKDSEGEAPENFYPKWPLALGFLMIVIHLLLAVASFGSGGGGMDLDADSINLTAGSSRGILGSIGLAASQLKAVFDWVAFVLLLSAYAVPGELAGFVKGKKGKTSNGKEGPITRSLLLFEGVEIVSGLMKWTGGLFGKGKK